MELQWKHMLSPSRLRLKVIGVPARNSGGKWEISISCVGNSLLNMTLSTLCRVGISSLHRWLSWVGPFIFSFPFDVFHVIMTSDSMDPKVSKLWSCVADMFKSYPSGVTLIPNCFVSSKIITSLCLTSMMWDTSRPSFDKVNSCWLQLIIWGVGLETPF